LNVYGNENLYARLGEIEKKPNRKISKSVAKFDTLILWQ